MTLRWAFSLLLVLAAVPPAAAQFGAAPAGPPPACQQLLTLRDEMQKHGQALQAAGQKKAAPKELCRLFKTYLAAGGRMAEALEEGAATCGVPAEVPGQIWAKQAKESQIAKQICDAATRVIPSRQYDAVPSCAEKNLRLGVPCVD